MSEKVPKQDKTFIKDYEQRITRLEVTNESIAQALLRIESRLDKLDNRIWQILLFNIATAGALLTVLAKGFHWL